MTAPILESRVVFSSLIFNSSRTPARRAAVEALVASAVADHQRTAFEADWRVAVFDVDKRALLVGSGGAHG